MAAPHLVSVDKYLVCNEAQRFAVDAYHIKTVYDLFHFVWFDCDRLPCNPKRMYVLKKRLINFMNARLRKTFIDLSALKRDNLVEFGGKYPYQFVALVVDQWPTSPKVQAPIAFDVATVLKSWSISELKTQCEKKGIAHYGAKAELIQRIVDNILSKRKPIVTTDVNCGLSDEEALSLAIRESLILTKPPPDELCCPITLELFRDPVSTIRGQIYERDAIVEWLHKSATDPISGCELKITTVWPDDEMRSRVEAFCAS